MTAFQVLQLAVPAVLTVVVAILAAWLAARFTLVRFYKERIWERKANAYTTILEALYLNQQWYEKHFDAAITHREMTEAYKEKLTRESNEAKSAMMRSVEGQTWLLSPEVGKIISDMEHALDDETHGSWQEMLDEGWGAIRKARDAITALARRDLSIVEKASSTMGERLSKWIKKEHPSRKS